MQPAQSPLIYLNYPTADQKKKRKPFFFLTSSQVDKNTTPPTILTCCAGAYISLTRYELTRTLHTDCRKKTTNSCTEEVARFVLGLRIIAFERLYYREKTKTKTNEHAKPQPFYIYVFHARLLTSCNVLNLGRREGRGGERNRGV